ncbi:hypothetical protein [Thalassiella azotivora]
MTRRPARRAIRTTAAIAVLALLTACGGGEDEETTAAEDTPAVELTEVEGSDPADAGSAPAPEDVAPVEAGSPQQLGPVTLDFPEGFAPTPDSTPEGPFVIAPENPAEGDPVITVVAEPGAKMTVAEYAQTLVDMSQGTEAASGVQQGPVEWPGAEEAHFVVLDKTLETSGGSVPSTQEALVLRSGDTLYLVTAVAAADAYDASGVGQALRSARIAA